MFDNYIVYSESYEILSNFKQKVLISFFSNLGQLGTQIVKRLKNDKVKTHIPVLDIAKNKSVLGIAEIRP